MELNCRICLKEAEIVIDLFEDVKDVDYSLDLQCNLSELLYQCGGLKIERDDYFSTYICYTCTKDLLYVAQFRQKCRLAEKTLKKLSKKEQESAEILENNVTVVDTATDSKSPTEDSDVNIQMDNSDVINDVNILVKTPEINNVPTSLQYVEPEVELLDNTAMQSAEGEEELVDILTLNYDEINQEEFLINDLIEYDEECPASDNNTALDASVNADCDTIITVDNDNFIPDLNANQFICDVCGAIFRLASNLRRHLTVAHVITQYFSCEKCNYCFSTIAKYKEHCSTCKYFKIKRKCSDFQCTHCGKNLSSTNALAIHLRMHTGERPFQCTTCSKAFKTNGALSIHIKRHLGKAEYSCEICNKLFYETSNLKIHMRTHTGEKPHKCNTCDKSFSRVFLLEAHRRVHSGERPFGCLYCEKRFKQLPDLKNHELTHAGEKKHKCDICNKSFIKKRQLISHMARHNVNNANVLTEYNNLNSLQRSVVESTSENEVDYSNKDLALQDETATALQSIYNEDEAFIEEI